MNKEFEKKKKELLALKSTLEELQKEVQVKKWKQEQQAKESEDARRAIIELGYDPEELSKEFFTKLEDEITKEKTAIEVQLQALKESIQENA